MIPLFLLNSTDLTSASVRLKAFSVFLGGAKRQVKNGGKLEKLEMLIFIILNIFPHSCKPDVDPCNHLRALVRSLLMARGRGEKKMFPLFSTFFAKVSHFLSSRKLIC